MFAVAPNSVSGARSFLRALPCVLVGCATNQIAERSFSRPWLDRVPLRTLEIVVVTKAPVFNLEALQKNAFEPLRSETALSASAEGELEEALRAELLSVGRARGFSVRGVKIGVAPAPAAEPPAAKTELTMTSTLTSSTASVSVGGPKMTQAPSPAPEPDVRWLPPGVTVREVLKSSTADAVLVLQALPIDRFRLVVESTLNPAATGSGASQNELTATPSSQETFVEATGRLILGQAYLLDAKTSVRLWSRRNPGAPSDGRLPQDHAFFKYGFVNAPGDSTENKERATRSAAAFAARALDGFPSASEGTPEGVQRLSAIDVESEQSRQVFLVQRHFALELNFSWGPERAGTGVRLGEAEAPDLGTGAVAPVGIFRGAPKFTYLAAGGLMFSAAVPFGTIPGRFQRSYYRDARPAQDGENAQSAVLEDVTIDGGWTGGVELTAGYAFYLSESWLFTAAGGGLIDVWNLDASPGAVIDNPRHVRFGALGDVGLLWMLPTNARFYGRIGGTGRLGGDTAGPFFFGFNLSLSVGLLL